MVRSRVSEGLSTLSRILVLCEATAAASLLLLVFRASGGCDFDFDCQVRRPLALVSQLRNARASLVLALLARFDLTVQALSIAALSAIFTPPSSDRLGRP